MDLIGREDIIIKEDPDMFGNHLVLKTRNNEGKEVYQLAGKLGHWTSMGRIKELIGLFDEYEKESK